MSEAVQPSITPGEVPSHTPAPKGELAVFDSIESLTKAVAAASGLTFDFASLTELASDFIEASEQYLIINVRDYDGGYTDNILFLTIDKAYLYSKTPPLAETCRPFSKMFGRPYGRSTVLAFVTLDKVLSTYKKRLDALINGMKELEQGFDSKKYRDFYFELERLNDRAEEFHDLLLRLQQRGYKPVETRYISFDYSVLIAESNSVQDRCQRRLSMLRDISRDNELRVTTELNLRIEKLNDIVKKLTAITVILMIPTLIASHFGMNFAFMPELHVSWAYPVVIGVQVVLMGIGVYLFRKIGWL